MNVPSTTLAIRWVAIAAGSWTAQAIAIDALPGRMLPEKVITYAAAFGATVIAEGVGWI
ncbi:MAG: hypothetical protein L0H31_11340 [Nocardioidaceae bacterium]|nr:hypothetical protein [Nocardioidaceae bacterium]